MQELIISTFYIYLCNLFFPTCSTGTICKHQQICVYFKISNFCLIILLLQALGHPSSEVPFRLILWSSFHLSSAKVIIQTSTHSISNIVSHVYIQLKETCCPVSVSGNWLLACCRFLLTEESNAHPTYKQKLLELDDTEYTNVFGRARWPDAPHRVLKTPFFLKWRDLPIEENESNQPVIGRSIIHGVVKTPNSPT